MEPHTIEECWQKLCDLESLVFGFIDNMNRAQEYTDADINGCRHTEGEISGKVNDITLIVMEKTAYIDDTEIFFTDVPDGVMTVCVTDGTNFPQFSVTRDGGIVLITFAEPLENVTKVTLTINK